MWLVLDEACNRVLSLENTLLGSGSEGVARLTAKKNRFQFILNLSSFGKDIL